jgi:hypothetical protein
VALEGRIDSLEKQLDVRVEELRRKDHMVGGLVERGPELGPAQEARNGHETAAEASEGESRPATGGAQ